MGWLYGKDGKEGVLGCLLLNIIDEKICERVGFVSGEFIPFNFCARSIVSVDITIVLGIVVFIAEPAIKSTSTLRSNKLECRAIVCAPMVCAINVPFAKVSGAIAAVFECVGNGGHILREWVIVCGDALVGIAACDQGATKR